MIEDWYSLEGFYKWVNIEIKRTIKKSVKNGDEIWFKKDENGNIDIEEIYIYNSLIPVVWYVSEIVETLKKFLIISSQDSYFKEKIKYYMKDIPIDIDKIAEWINVLKFNLALEYAYNNADYYIKYWECCAKKN